MEHASSVGDEVLGTHLQLSLLSPDLWKKWLEDSTKARGRLAEAAGNGSTAIRKLGGVFSTHKTGGGGFSDDLLKSLQKYADIDFKAKLSALRTEVEQGLLGLISTDEGLGLADSGEEREQQRKSDKDRRVHDGGLAADDLGYLQLLVGVSTIAQLTPSSLAQEAMHVVYKVLTSRKSSKDKATKKHWGSLCDVITRWREDGVRLMWISFIGNSVHGTAISLPI